ncbi:hypothetical protein [Planctellipticum variicoloris]|uniref:hypothetical protein n=1 Tax=Planctellipticum variicoloris TaxID=3064265 RepID=UPI0030140DFB|nr:hypothetical protein SH412_005305 [Planctomycetaceae bacterium SH412]
MPRRNRYQHDLDCAVASATGEDLATIRRLGFSSIDLTDDDFDPEPNLLPPQFIDWDEFDLSRKDPVVCQSVSAIRRVA